MPKLKEGDTTPDPQAWCNGFVEGMAYHREDWATLLSTELGFDMMVPILLTSDPDEIQTSTDRRNDSKLRDSGRMARRLLKQPT